MKELNNNPEVAAARAARCHAAVFGYSEHENFDMEA